MNRTIEPFEFYYAVKVIVMDAITNYDQNYNYLFKQGRHAEDFRWVRIATRRAIGTTYVASRLYNDFPSSCVFVQSSREYHRVSQAVLAAGLPTSIQGPNDYRYIDPADMYVAEQADQLAGRQFELCIIDGSLRIGYNNMRNKIFHHIYGHCKIVVELA